MRLDQYEKLQQLEEKLLDVFIREADPLSWPGQGLPLSQMDAQTRGDLYWCRKTAASALVLASKVANVIGTTQASGMGTAPPAEGDENDGEGAQVDAEIASAEREAARLMRELQNGPGKKAFDRRAHGKSAG